MSEKKSFEDFIQDIENEKEQLDFQVDAELRKRGWHQSSSHPGALWLWEKNNYRVPKSHAIMIEKWWDAYPTEAEADRDAALALLRECLQEIRINEAKSGPTEWLNLIEFKLRAHLAGNKGDE